MKINDFKLSYPNKKPKFRDRKDNWTFFEYSINFTVTESKTKELGFNMLGEKPSWADDDKLNQGRKNESCSF